jgi:hypothetical protein
MNGVWNGLDQRRGVGIESEGRYADDSAVLDDGAESAPMGMVGDEIAAHGSFP